jgi:hypothetical protein
MRGAGRDAALVLVTTVAAAVTVLLALSAAPAFGCSQGSHCYGTVRWRFSPNYYGGVAALQVARLEQSDTPTVNTGDFVDQEMWVGTNADGTGAYWVEDGMSRGWPQSASAGIYWFWADNRPCCSYFEHDFLVTIRTSTTYTAKINFIGNNSWNVYRDGNLLSPGTSTSNPAPSNYLESGLEATNTNAHVNGTGGSLQKRSAGGTSWSYGWSGASPLSNSPALAQWTAAPTDYKDTMNPNTASALATLTHASSAVASTFAGPPDPAVLITEAARLNGEPSPTAIRTVATTRAAAFTSVGAGADDVPATPVQLVVAHGAFTGFEAKRPPGASPPRGHVLFLLIDSASGVVTDWGIGNIDPQARARAGVAGR